MTETKKTINESAWGAILSLLEPAYPTLTREKLEFAINEVLSEKLEFVTSRDACRMLGVTVQTLYRWEKLGFIHAKRPSARKVMYSVSDIRKKLGA